VKIRVVLFFSILLAACGSKQGAVEQPLGVIPGCDAAKQACQARGGAGTLSLQLMGPVRPLQPFTYRLAWEGAPVHSMSVDFQMVGMDMGENRYQLTADGAGPWHGSAILPVCTSGRSDWVADVRVHTADGLTYNARIPFVAEH